MRFQILHSSVIADQDYYFFRALLSGFSLCLVRLNHTHISATLEGGTAQPREQDGEPLPDGEIVEGTPLEGRCA